MKSWFRHPLRVTGRLIWFGGEILVGAIWYLFCCMGSPATEIQAWRTRWLRGVCRRVLRIFRTTVQVSGPVPTRGFMVCNHLSYMDILVISACTPVVFIAKREVKGWPVFGWFARLAGTLFVHRESRTHVGRVASEIEAVLMRGSLVVLFPEGTSSGGETVLPFKSSLLEPVAKQSHPITSALIGYELTDGNVSEEVCYWKDMTLVPHLVNLMSKDCLKAIIQFKPSQASSRDRKELARLLHAEVLGMMQATAC